MAATFPDVKSIQELTYEDFTVKDLQLKDTIKRGLKVLFDYARQCDVNGIGSGIPELCIEGFDDEQIWTMIQMETDPILAKTTKKVDHLANNEESVVLVDESDMESSADDSEGEESDSEGEEESEDDQSDEDDESEDEQTLAEKAKSIKAKSGRRDEEDPTKAINFTTEVDDKFFSIDAMERFVDMVEKDEAAGREYAEKLKAKRKEKYKGKVIDDDSDADSYNDSEESEPEDMLYKSDNEEDEGATFYYEDFFGPKDDKQKNNNKTRKHAAVDEDDENDRDSDQESFDDEAFERVHAENENGQGSSSEDDDEEEKDDEPTPEEFEAMSKLEKEQYKLKQEIKKLEQQAMGDKEWQLTGEASGKKRPENSLLEQGDLEINYLARNAPVITQETTESIEDMIKRRIKDADFDDVERRKPMAQEADYRAKDELSMEKSKEGLGDIYAKDYEVSVLGHKTQKEEARTKDQEELHDMFTSLCHKLDSLSNFHYTPKPPQLEVAVQSNVSAIQMEEVTPMAVSSATQAAPHEIYKAKRGKEAPLGKSLKELNSEERQALRRSKKAARRKDRRQKEADKRLVQKLNPGLGNKYAAEKMLDSLASKNVTRGELSTEKGNAAIDWTKSGQVFKRLQEDANLGDEGVKKKPRTKGASKTGSSYRL